MDKRLKQKSIELLIYLRDNKQWHLRVYRHCHASYLGGMKNYNTAMLVKRFTAEKPVKVICKIAENVIESGFVKKLSSNKDNKYIISQNGIAFLKKHEVK